MLVRDLINNLSELHPDLLVVVSRDEEGNGFLPVREISDDNNMYEDGEVGLHHLTPGLESQQYTEEDLRLTGNRCIVLWP